MRLLGRPHRVGAVRREHDDEFERLRRPPASRRRPAAAARRRAADRPRAPRPGLRRPRRRGRTAGGRGAPTWCAVPTGWTVLRDPAGMLYCVTGRGPGRGLTVEIREATAERLAEIWPFFPETVRAGETYAYDPDADPRPGAGAVDGRPPGATVVAVDGGVVLGSAKMGPNRPAARGAHRHGELHGRRPRRAGRGSDGRWRVHVVDWHRSHGFRGIQFNAVVETNTAAVALWTSLGFDGHRHRPRSVRAPGARLRRAARDVPTAGLTWLVVPSGESNHPRRPCSTATPCRRRLLAATCSRIQDRQHVQGFVGRRLFRRNPAVRISGQRACQVLVKGSAEAQLAWRVGLVAGDQLRSGFLPRGWVPSLSTRNQYPWGVLHR